MSHIDVDIICETVGSSTICSGYLSNTTSTALFVDNIPLQLQQVFMRFTAGEVIISLFLFLIFMTGIFSILWFGIIKPHIHKIHLK